MGLTTDQIKYFVGRKYTITYDGKIYFPLEPTKDHISIRDIAHCSSMLCRFGGHIKKFFSIAQHSVMVAERVHDPKKKLKALLHDGSEAYLNDMIHPVKYLPEMDPYRALEKKTEEAIADHFGFSSEKDDDIKTADNVQLVVEALNLMPVLPEWAVVMAHELGINKDEEVIEEFWTPEDAEHYFMMAYNKYSEMAEAA